MATPEAAVFELSVFGPGIGECSVLHLGNGNWAIVDSCLSAASGRPIALDYLESLGVEPNRIDILTSISGVEFDEIWERRVASKLGGVPVYFISLDDLLENKRSTGRLKDAADVDELGRTEE